jgi:pseudaminic acid synthase
VFMENRSFNIEGITIGKNNPPFVIAEMSGNHMGSFERAKKIIEEVAKSKAHAIKLQTYTADTMTIEISEGEFYIEDEKSIWNHRSLYDLYNEAHTPWDWHAELFKYARSLGLIPFSTPFDSTAVDFLENLNVSIYKIASFEITDLDLIQKVASTGKPVIISTGMATISEIADAVLTARSSGCKNLILLKCTSSYPAKPEDANLITIPHLSQIFNYQVGISDHTLGIGVSIAAVSLGATVIEKHVTLDRNDGAVDSLFSLEPNELRDLVIESDLARKSVGSVNYGPLKNEELSQSHRRSLYIVKDLKKGERLDHNNLRAIRPGRGLEIKFRKNLIGKKIKKDIKKGTPASWDLFE